MNEDLIMDDQEKRQQQRQRQDRDPEKADACGSDSMRPMGQWNGATMTGPGPQSDKPTPGLLYISQPNPLRTPSLTTSSTDANQVTKSMAKSLGRTQTLGQIGRTESFSDVFSTPVSDASGAAPTPSSSMLQHRESSAVLNDDDDDEEHNKVPGIRIDVDGDDDPIDTTQLIAGSQDVSMSEPLSVRQPTSSTIRAPAFRPSNTNLAVDTTIKTNAQRFPSPIPTEPEDPDPEYISNQLAEHHIKPRDFAWYPPYITSAPPPPAPSDVVTVNSSAPISASLQYDNDSTAVNVTHFAGAASVPAIPFTPETFDPYKALGEFEFRLRQTPRTLPIPGKAIRRLIEIGWVTENEVESRCSEDDLKGLEDFDSRNRTRLLKLIALREQREKQFCSAKYTPATTPATSENQDTKPGAGLPMNEGYTSTGAYPYVTLRFESVPTFAERNELVHGVRPLFHTIDRVIRMALAMERERERDRQEAEEALMKRRRDEEEKERAERECVEREVLAENVDKDEEMQEVSDGGASTTVPTTPVALQPPAEITSASPQAVNPRKRSPHEAWADEGNNTEDNDIEDLEVKRLRLARSQSETWYEQQRRLQQQQQQPESRPASGQNTPSRDNQLRLHSQSPWKGIAIPSHSRNPSTSNSQSQPQQAHSRSQSQSQSQPFVPPEIQYPAPLATYDPELYPDAASAIESQSQQSQSQGRRHPHNYRPGVETPPVSDDEGDGEVEADGEKGKGKEKKSIMVGRGFGLTEDGEEDTSRPNALKRSPKKGVKRGLTRGRTLVQIC